MKQQHSWKLMAAGLGLAAAPGAYAQAFTPGDLVVSRSVYGGSASTVTIGQTLPSGVTAIANGAYPNVFLNNTADGSFGITAPIYLDQMTTTGAYVSTLAVPTSLVTTSFSSKSELALNLSTDGTALTFMGYAAPVNALDVSNSNTPGIAESGNYTANATYREVAQVNAAGTFQATTTNAYDGNNGRAAVLDSADHQYLTVGNAGNANGGATTTAANGVQIVTPGVNATAATPGTIKVGSFSVNQVNPATGLPYSTTTKDKTSKDDNYRGETVFNNTLYVTKGSGGNGINSVYQVGKAGTLPTAANAATAPINVLPGFNVLPEKVGSSGFYPFGLFFANATTLYVADEGAGTLMGPTPAADPLAGLEKWSLNNNVWSLDYTLQTGLSLGVQYGVSGSDPLTGALYPTALDPATDGLRNITGKVNGDGTVSIFGVTSTVSASGDQGTDPNKLVSITDSLAATTLPTGESFTTLETAGYGNVLRGVAFAPSAAAVPEAPAGGLLLLGLLPLGLLAARRRCSHTG